jgi:hypothetical protein
MQPLFKPQLKLVRSKAPNQAERVQINRSIPVTKEAPLPDKAFPVQTEVLVEEAVELLRGQCQHHLLLRTDL